MNNTQQQKVVISGANGLVGTELAHHLKQSGYPVLALIRPHSKWDGDALRWEPSKQTIDKKAMEGIATVIHLSGEGIASGRWTKEKKNRIRESRVDVTRFLSTTLGELADPPKTLICASAVGYYGDRGDEVLTESSDPGKGFLPEVSIEWEAATLPAFQAGIRVINLRFGVILTTKGGALKQMMTPFKLGVAGKLGSGKQYMPWISIKDTLSVIEFAIKHQELEGAVNVTSPNPVTNYEFTKTMGSVLCRPTVLPAPAIALQLIMGEMANALLLASTRAIPKKLVDHGYVFQHPQLHDALHDIIQNKL